MLILLSRIYCTIIIANLHAFHVSVCEVYHNADTHSLEISMKIFIDDLELAIKNQGINDFSLVTTNDKYIIDFQLEKYIKDQFKIKVNSKEANLKFVGFEFKGYEILCYLEATRIDEINSVEIENSILLELFDSQINLTHFQYKDKMKSIKTTRDMRSGIIDVSEW